MPANAGKFHLFCCFKDRADHPAAAQRPSKEGNWFCIVQTRYFEYSRTVWKLRLEAFTGVLLPRSQILSRGIREQSQNSPIRHFKKHPHCLIRSRSCVFSRRYINSPPWRGGRRPGWSARYQFIVSCWIYSFIFRTLKPSPTN